jgi:anti-sigma factor RsiW
MALTKEISCHQAVALVSDYLEGALSRRERRILERHLGDCEACSAYLEQMKVTIALSGSARLVEVFEKYQREVSDE